MNGEFKYALKVMSGIVIVCCIISLVLIALYAIWTDGNELAGKAALTNGIFLVIGVVGYATLD